MAKDSEPSDDSNDPPAHTTANLNATVTISGGGGGAGTNVVHVGTGHSLSSSSGGSGGNANLIGAYHAQHTFAPPAWNTGIPIELGTWDAGMAFRQDVCRSGHMMGAELVQEDGTVTGTCSVCGDVINGRRLAGGLVFEKLQLVVEGVLAGLGDLAAEILAAEAALETERERLEDAEHLLSLAKQMLVRP